MPPKVNKKTADAPGSNRRTRAGEPWSLDARANGPKVLKAAALERIPWLVHGFSTRPGGVSEIAPVKPGAHSIAESMGALNLGFTDSDSRENVLENRSRFFRALDANEMPIAALRQTHSDRVHLMEAGGRANIGAEAPQADALITDEPGVLLTIQTADCLPILLADTKNKAVAAVHSGWRGTVQRLAEKTLGRMRMEFGTPPEHVIAAIGPGIGRSCYEVGVDVAGEFAAKFPAAREWFDGPYDSLASGENDPNWLPWLTMKPPGHAPPPLRVNLDLIAANRWILENAGIPAAQICSSDLCTACRLDLFFSYRREGPTGRMMAAIGIRE